MTEASGLDNGGPSELEPTGAEDIKKVKKHQGGQTVELPPFLDGTPFIVRLRRPSLLHMAKLGQFPNPLTSAVDELMSNETRPRSSIEDRAKVLSIVARAAMEEPSFDDVEEVIDSFQLMAIWEYVMNGVKALEPFRAIRDIFVASADERAVEATAKSGPGD